MNFAAPFRMRLQMQLARLYRETGRERDAEKVEAELSRLLAYADPDHSIVRQLASMRKPLDTLASK